MNYERLKFISDEHGYNILPVKTGMQVELHERVGEGSTERIWKFKGLIIKVRKPGSADGTFTIRGLAAGQTIEKVYPLSFPKFEKVLLLDEYIRSLIFSGKLTPHCGYLIRLIWFIFV